MNQPKQIITPWAENGLKNDIPNIRELSTPQEGATYQDGFPSITMTPISVGGKPPSGRDMNGILYEITANLAFLGRGKHYKFNQDYCSAINGYPKGAILINNAETALYISKVDQNQVDFNSQPNTENWTILADTALRSDLLTEIAKKANVSHTHTMSQITDFELKNLSTEDLDTVKKAGMYGQAASANATTARHYPETQAGALLVMPSAYGWMQIYIAHSTYRIYIRNANNSDGWLPWVRMDGRDKANINSPTFTGSPKAPTPAQTVNDTTIATTAFVKSAIAALVGSAPEALDTLAEIATALANDGNLKQTLLTEIGKKANANHTHTIAQVTGLQAALDEAGTKGLPVGAVVAFPLAVTNPQGFLKCDGSTFNQATYPDLYAALGNKNKLPDLRRSDVGLTAWFPIDAIPSGWIAFDDIATQVTQQSQSELYNLLVAKYGALANVPKVGDRFIRNAGNGLIVGQKQTGSLAAVESTDGSCLFSINIKRLGENSNSSLNNAGLDGINSEDVEQYNAGVMWGGRQDTEPTLTGITQRNNSGGHFVGVSRPRALVLKLCIKVKNNFDDAQFWIKAFGSINNAGAMDASRLGQAIQDISAQLENQNFNPRVNQLIESSVMYQKVGDFEIRKYPDGTMVQTYNKSNTHHNNGEVNFNWAISFVDKPVLTWGLRSREQNIRDCFLIFNENKTTNSQVSCWLFEPTYQRTDFILNVVAIGRWK